MDDRADRLDRPGDRDLRVSDAERTHVAELLERATGRGLIDLDEFTARVDLALAARTRAQLNAVLVDLPGMVHPDRPAAAPTGIAAAPTRGATPVRVAGPDTDRTVLSAAFGSVTRRGAWEVPARLTVRNAVGSSELDFTEAHLPDGDVDIAVDVTAGSVEIRVPDGSLVEHGGVSVLLGSLEDRRRTTPAPDGPRFVLSGTVRLGSVEIRGPRRGLWRRLTG